MFDPNADEQPFNPIPTVILVLIAVIAGIELFFQAGASGFIGGKEAIGWRLEYAQTYGWFDPLFETMRQNNQWSLAALSRLLTYSFIHMDFMHALFVLVFIAAIGKFVAEIMHPASVLLVFFTSAVVGALCYSLAFADAHLMIGASPAAYGLIGAFTWLMFHTLREQGGTGARAFILIGFLMFLQLLWKLLFGGGNEWFAELTGFFTGFLVAIAVSPGGFSRATDVLTRLRKR